MARFLKPGCGEVWAMAMITMKKTIMRKATSVGSKKKTNFECLFINVDKHELDPTNPFSLKQLVLSNSVHAWFFPFRVKYVLLCHVNAGPDEDVNCHLVSVVIDDNLVCLLPILERKIKSLKQNMRLRDATTSK